MLTRSPYWDYTELDPIRIQFQVDNVTEASLREHLTVQAKFLEQAIARGDRAYVIIAAPGEHRTPPEVRKLQAQWLEEHRDAIVRNTVGMGFVIDNPLVRGALTAVFWVSRPPVPYKVHPTLAEAIEYGVTFCRQQGMTLPDEALRPDAAARAELARDRVRSYRVAL